MEVRQQNQREHSQAFTDGEGFVRNHEPASALGAEEAAGSRAQTGVWLPASRYQPDTRCVGSDCSFHVSVSERPHSKTSVLMASPARWT